jgi:hypothetical protein
MPRWGCLSVQLGIVPLGRHFAGLLYKNPVDWPSVVAPCMNRGNIVMMVLNGLHCSTNVNDALIDLDHFLQLGSHFPL